VAAYIFCYIVAFILFVVGECGLQLLLAPAALLAIAASCLFCALIATSDIPKP
jgi:hypothetical protein